jgi:sigma-B regulation protein RsbU (phosphoserine phosphatase)
MHSSLRPSKNDLVRARIIQEAMLPEATPASFPLDIAAKWVPAVEVGGDFFDCVVDAEDQLHFVIGDVTGHGITAALRMAETQAYFRALMRHAESERVEPQDVLEQANRLLTVSVLEIPLLTTAMIATWNSHTGAVSWCGAGHSGFLLRASGDVELLGSTGPILGCVEAASYAVRSTSALHSGDCILLVTDGIAESSQERLRLFGQERMLQCLRRSAGETSATMLDRLFEEAGEFCGAESQQDDMTAVLVRAL